ncbi:protein insensitive-like isoform X1 [Lucilia cuprina]|uniref:protein insensitive-like isoform X1 n=2 Tax=Lucilia cuprina TaxID=7375 RepID=UPI001F061724|nr:protein insensitive-like isoform X1 [Lucilia cuprina]
MEVKMISPLPPMSVMIGSAQKFHGIPEPGDRNNRPLMVNAWSQTTSDDFSYINETENRRKQSVRENELEEKIRILEENLKAHTDLLTQIHATSARTTALLSQQPSTTQQFNSNVSINSPNNTNIISANRTPQLSPKIVNAMNPIQQINYSPAESVKYTIIAEGAGNDNGEPIEIQLAEDDGALNLNSSADSGRLEICLASKDNIEIKTEYNNGNNIIPMQQQVNAVASTLDTTPSEHHFIKRPKMATEQLEALSTTTKCLNNDETVTTYNCVPPKLPVQKRHSSGNSLLKTSKVQINNVQTTTLLQNTIHSPLNNSDSSFNSANGETNSIGIDTDNVMVSIGPNNTRIPAKLYENMNWSSASIATRKLLMAIFDRNVLATHSMTGKPSPAFKDHGKPVKQMLDPLIVADIIFAVTRKCKVSDKEVRNAITTKCADENKMMKLQINKRTPMREINKENMMRSYNNH